jgi:dienelactone hydrolase
MSYREDVREAIVKLLEQMPPEEGYIDREIRRVYAKALEEAKLTGASVESMTYEVLEGIEEGLATYPERIEPTLARAARVIADLLHHSATEDIARQKKRLTHAKRALEQTIEAEKTHLMESLDALHAYANDRHYPRLQESLYQTQSMVKEHILKLAGEIMYNHEQA